MPTQIHRLAKTVAVVLISMMAAGFAEAATDVPDGWITTKVKLALLTTEGVSGTDVNVDTIDGHVTLHGTVGSDAEKAKAEQLAASTSGVREVRSLLQVASGRTQPGLQASDAQIRQRVEAALKADEALADSRIAVESVNAGVVLLSGQAKSLSDSYRAVRVATRVEGVRRVASEIQSTDEMADLELWREGRYDAPRDAKSAASDMWITTEAKVRLLARSDTPGFDINVDTENGVVTLFGAIDSAVTKKQAESVVREVDGVVNVVNDLQIVTPDTAKAVARSDAQISDEIEKRFEDRASLSDSEIDVEVSGGVARLTGSVQSRGDQVTALTVARSTDGVKRVIDDLQLAAPPPVSAR
jgi:hyperosmotically inducible protein